MATRGNIAWASRDTTSSRTFKTAFPQHETLVDTCIASAATQASQWSLIPLSCLANQDGGLEDRANFAVETLGQEAGAKLFDVTTITLLSRSG